MIKDRTGALPLPIHLPIGAENEFAGLVNLITMQEWVWDSEDLGRHGACRIFGPIWLDKAAEMRSALVELAVEQDDDVMEKFLEGEEPDIHFATLIRLGTLNMSFVPVLCGSAFKNKGVQPMLNAVIDYLPGPLDVPAYTGLRQVMRQKRATLNVTQTITSRYLALAFKIMNDPFVGSLTFVRLYSGTLKKR